MRKLIGSVLVVAICISSFFVGFSLNGSSHDDCIPINDISIAYHDSNDYLTLQVGDLGNVGDDINGRTYESIKEEINKGFKNVAETDDGVLFTYKNGTGFYIEK